MVVNNWWGLVTLLVVGGLLPLVVDLITRKTATSRFSSLITLFLALVVGLVTAFMDWVNTTGGVEGFDWESLLFNAAVTFAAAVIAFIGLWKPTGVSGSDGAIRSAVPGGLAIKNVHPAVERTNPPDGPDVG